MLHSIYSILIPDFCKKKEEKKKEERMKKLEESLPPGQKLGDGKNSKTWREEYNPLMNSGSGSTYRAPKRSACSGGGCGGRK